MRISCFLLGCLFSVSSAFGLTSEQRDEGLDVLESLSIETEIGVDVFSDAEFSAEGLNNRINGSVSVIDFYDRVNEVFKFNVKNNAGSDYVEIGVIECALSYKTRLGENKEERVTRTFTGKVGGHTAQAKGNKKLCTRGFACGFIVKVVGCNDSECQRYFGPTAINLANEGSQYDDICMLEATTRLKAE